MRRSISVLVIVALGVIVLAQHGTPPTQADSTARMANISVSVFNGVATYDLCVLGAVPPLGGGVIITDSSGSQHHAAFVSTTQMCGSGIAAVQASFTGLAAGSYQFQTACLVTSGAGSTAPCLDRATGLISNFQAASVNNQCQVDFDPGVTVAPRNCVGPGVDGDLTNLTAQPTGTPTVTETFTPSPTPPVNTPTASPTPTPCVTRLPLAIKAPLIVFSGQMLTVRVATVPEAQVVIAVSVLTQQPVTLAKLEGGADVAGHFVGGALITYRPIKSVPALVTVRAIMGCGSVIKATLVGVLP